MSKPRKYEQRLRAEAAEETRQRILDAVYARLKEAPAERISVDRIARMAGVARSTVYLVFGSRGGLFDAFAEQAFERAGSARLTEAVTQDDARERLRGGFRAGSQMIAADRDVFAALFAMAKLDPEAVGGAITRAEEKRMQSMEWMAGLLADDGVLRPGLTPAEAAHQLWLLTSFEAFDLLYTGRGLSAAQAADTLIDMAERSLLADPS